MACNQVPVGHIYTHNPQQPWINEKTKTWWIGNHDTKQPYRGVKGDSVKGDMGDRGNGWFLLSSSTDVSPEGAITDDLIMNSGTGDIMVVGVIVEPGEYVQVVSVNPFQVTDVLGSLKGPEGPEGPEGDTIVGPPGNSLEIRYAKNKDPENAPALNRSDRNPEGWSIETINPETDEFVWEIRAYIDNEGNLVGTWSNPFRNTGMPGEGGSISDGVFKSTAFTVSPTQPATPAGGTWLSPVPTTPGWYDGIPDEDGPRWMSTRIFTLSGTSPQEPNWSEPVLLADSADVDIEFSSVVVNPGNPTDNPGNWSDDSDSTTEWMAIRKYANGEWGDWKISKIKGENGLDGGDGQDGQDGQDGTGYEFQYTVTNRGDSPPSITNDVIWSSTFPGAIDSSQTLWYRQRTVTGSSTGVWVGPIKMTGTDGETIEGPSMAYRGDWSAIKEYSGSSLVVDVVKYAGLGYIARTDAGEIPVGTLPTDTNYWNEFTENIDSLFTDFLFAYSAYVQNLTVGQVSTGVEPAVVPDPTLSGERFTVGFQPSSSNDPTSTLSRHGMRLYFPSGRIMMYQGWVDNFDVGDGTALTNKGVTIWFKDDENSPVDYYIDGGVITIVTESDVTRWYHTNLRLLNHAAFNVISPTDPDATVAFETAINSAGTPNGVVSSFLNGLFQYESLYGSVWINRTTTAWNKVVTGTTPSSKYVTANNGESFIPDGWYFIGTGSMHGIEVSGIDLDPDTSTGWPKYVDLVINLKFFYITNGDITNTADPIANLRMSTTSPQATGTLLDTNKTAQYTEEFIIADN